MIVSLVFKQTYETDIYNVKLHTFLSLQINIFYLGHGIGLYTALYPLTARFSKFQELGDIFIVYINLLYTKLQCSIFASCVCL